MRRELELLRDDNATLTAAMVSLQDQLDKAEMDNHQSWLRRQDYSCDSLPSRIETLEDKTKEQKLRIDQIGKKFVQSDQYNLLDEERKMSVQSE